MVHKLLSVVVASVPERHHQLQTLYDRTVSSAPSDVEVLVLTDNRSMSIGRKRQLLNMMASGEYVVHVDDDDTLSLDFVDSLLEAIRSNRGVDVITFLVEVCIDEGSRKPCVYSPSFAENMNFDDHYQRLPNTRCCFRRRLALKEEIPDMAFGEDDAWGRRIAPHIQSHYAIPRVLYFYNAITSKPSDWFEAV